MFFQERIADLTRKMLRKKLYVVLSKPVQSPEALQPFLSAHLEYMIALEKGGCIFASGPLSDGGDGPPSGQGLTILRAKSAAEARALAEGDPFFVNGLRTFELKEWTVMEGSLGLRVNLSDQSIDVA
ncbi:MAG TPA: YciI family protein [Xanthobacteraceae bacterium]|nr:YciI family protein [Xanthobacteraceae bacterium]